MSSSEKPREGWMMLAELAAREQNPKQLLALVTEINELLGEKQPASNFALPPTTTSASGRRHLCERGGTRMNSGYDWEESYRAAILETDNGKLLQRVRAAKAAIDSRLEVLQLDHGGTPEERQAIADALAGLNALRSELETLSHDADSSKV